MRLVSFEVVGKYLMPQRRCFDNNHCYHQEVFIYYFHIHKLCDVDYHINYTT